jgi:wyosine [tRNA(Phe)-imidazoG37] synthetase (radical SAM superfamily)
MERADYAPVDEVVEEIRARLAEGPRPDFVTLSGSGEPTLYSRLDELIEGVRSMTDIPIAVLTNGSLLWREQVRRELMNADLVIPSLDAGHAGMFQTVNRPHESITFEQMLEGLVAFRAEYRGEYWLEVLLLAGYTAVDAEIHKIADCVRRIRPDRVQLNTATRPTAEDFAARVDRRRLAELASRFDPPAEVIADYRSIHARSDLKAGRENVLDMIRRRPCCLEDIADGLGMHRNEVLKHLEALDAAGLLEKRTTGDRLYYGLRRTANLPIRSKKQWRA